MRIPELFFCGLEFLEISKKRDGCFFLFKKKPAVRNEKPVSGSRVVEKSYDGRKFPQLIFRGSEKASFMEFPFSLRNFLR